MNNHFVLLIPSYRIERLEKVIVKLNKIAIKSNSPTIEYQKLNTEIKKVYKSLNSNQKINVEFTNVEFYVDGMIGYNDWRFLAKLDHDMVTPIIHTIKGESIPEYYYNAKPHCDHCNSDRKRNNTYILQNNISGEYKQVGSSCLAQFLKIDVEKWISMFTSIFLEEEINDELWDEYEGGRIPSFYELSHVLALGLWDIKRYGYVSKKKAEECTNNVLIPTSESVGNIMFGPDSIGFMIKNQDEINSYKEKVNNIIEYCKGLESTTEYFHNLKVLTKEGYCKATNFGFVVSMIPLYERNHEVNQEGLNEYYGNVKDKVELELTVTNVFPISTQYGYCDNIIMKDDEGRTFKWFTSTNQNIEKGSKIKIKGTIKAHSEYKGVCNTELTRCKIL